MIVYFIRAGARGPIKIGSTNDLKARLASLQTASPHRLRLIGAIPGGIELERGIHRLLTDHRIAGGEWFRPAADVRRWAQLAAVIDGRHPEEIDETELKRALRGHLRQMRLLREAK